MNLLIRLIRARRAAGILLQANIFFEKTATNLPTSSSADLKKTGTAMAKMPLYNNENAGLPRENEV